MSEIDLSTLSRRELRRLLDASRERGQAEASYQILREMESRRQAEETRKGLFPGRRGAKPHVVALDLGDPMAQPADDLPPPPNWRAPPEMEGEVVAKAPVEPLPQIEAAEPQLAPKPPRPRRKPTPAAAPAIAVEEPAAAEVSPPQPEPEPEPDPEPVAPAVAETPVAEAAPAAPERQSEPAVAEAAPLGPEPEPQPEPVSPQPAATPEAASENVFAHPLRVERREPAPARGAPKSRTGLAFAAGALLGVAAGWGVSQFTRPEPPPAAPPVQVAAAQPPPPAPVVPPTEPAQPSEPSPLAAEFQPQTPPDLAPPAPEPPPPEEPKPVAAEPIDVPPPHVEAAAPVIAARRAEVAIAPRSCAAEQTPADRVICTDPKLKRLQQQLQRAYALALDAHEDRDLLRQRQLAWRDERNSVTDPGRLAEIYEARIRKLNSATEEARREQE